VTARAACALHGIWERGSFWAVVSLCGDQDTVELVTDRLERGLSCGHNDLGCGTRDLGSQTWPTTDSSILRCCSRTRDPPANMRRHDGSRNSPQATFGRTAAVLPRVVVIRPLGFCHTSMGGITGLGVQRGLAYTTAIVLYHGLVLWTGNGWVKENTTGILAMTVRAHGVIRQHACQATRLGAHCQAF